MAITVQVNTDELIAELRALPEEAEKARKVAARKIRTIQYREALKTVAANTTPPTSTEVLKSNKRVFSAVSRRDPGNVSLWVGLKPILQHRRRNAANNVYVYMDDVPDAVENELLPRMADYYQTEVEKELNKAVRS